MGVPEEDYPQLKLWCGSRAALGWGRPAPGDQVEIATSMAAYRRYLRDLVDLRAGQPGDDLTSDLLAIHREDPDRLTREEISSILFSLSFAGHETTTGLIGNTMRRLLEDPARWARVAGQPDLIPAAVEETLRYDPVGAGVAPRDHAPRHDRRGGPARGRQAVPVAGGGGRDGAVFADPDTFDLDRANAGQHLAFGLELHYCLGRQPGPPGNPAGTGGTGPPVSAAAARRGPGVHLPPQHLLPRPAGAAGADRRRAADPARSPTPGCARPGAASRAATRPAGRSGAPGGDDPGARVEEHAVAGLVGGEGGAQPCHRLLAPARRPCPRAGPWCCAGRSPRRGPPRRPGRSRRARAHR